VYYYDIDTKRIKTSTHGIFDEAYITIPQADRSSASQALIDLGYRQEDDAAPAQESQAPPVAQILLRTPTAKLPTQGSILAAGYDVYSTVHCVLQPQMVTKVPLDFTLVPRQGTYVQLHSRSGLASKGIIVYAGVIDPDYRGDITVLLYNSGSNAFTVNVGDRIAQLIFHNISTPVLLQEAQLNDTARADQGFGSTGLNSATDDVPQVSQVTAPQLNPVDMPYNIFLSQDPFDDVITVTVKDFGTHSTMGMILQQCSQRNKPRLVDIQPSQPCSRIKKWRSTIKNGYITQIEEYPISSIDDVKAAISASRTKPLEYIHIEVALDIKPTGIHPVEGIPQLFSDQLSVIQQHLQSIRDHTYTAASSAIPQQPQVHTITTPPDIHNTLFQQFVDTQHPVLHTLLDHNYDMEVDIPLAATATSSDLNDDIPQPSTLNPDPTLCLTEHPPQHPVELPPSPPVEPLPPPPPEAVRYTWKQIKDDPEWLQACFHQLDQYQDQDMFEKPQPKLVEANAWPLVWTFLQKPDKKKARCTVDGSKRWRRNVKLGHTYANSLATDSERLFWAIAAKWGLIVVGADVSNAFAEAPAPGDTFYIIPDHIFQLWWVQHKKRQPIPSGWVLKVKFALQGHPESPRLWEQHTRQILTGKLGYKSMHHEKCLYQAVLYGHWTMLLRQVDDFALAVDREATGKNNFNDIDKHLRIRIKYLGVLKLFNGMDITQTKYYLKLHCTTYLTKIIQTHQWNEATPKHNPIPYPANNSYAKALDLAIPQDTPAGQQQLSRQYNMHYRQIIGEFIWPMIKCRPDISFHITKLSQFMANPAEVHYQALCSVGSYLANTLDTGIYYWRDVPRQDLPDGPLPALYQEPFSFQEDPARNSLFITAYADSDWGTCRKTRNAITGAVIMVAGGVVGYKTKFQHAIALSSTEAEWVAACDAGKMILYFCTLLDDLGIPQEEATVMYEDNRGALFMANAQQPSSRTRHIDIKTFALTDWVEQDLITLVDILTSENCADHMTKALTKALFYRHTDTLMGRQIPDYVTKQLPLEQIIRSLFFDGLRCTHAKTMGG
jgi:deoxyuridine 5'-triphosphate nucleotidohydrolase